jgi:hypothetical protein
MRNIDGLNRLTALCLSASIAFVAATASADTILRLEVDPAASSLTYSCTSPCEGGTFTLSGNFALQLFDPMHAAEGYGNASLQNLTVEANGILPVPVGFATFASLGDGEIEGNNDLCSWPGPPGSSGVCVVSGRIATFSGTFDGEVLRITGYEPLSWGLPPKFDFSSYHYEIVANVVPEPSLSIVGICSLLLVARSRRERGRTSSGA